jgi:hypothetical protein
MGSQTSSATFAYPTAPDSSQTTSSEQATAVPAGAIAGAVIAGVVTILLAMLALWYLTRRKHTTPDMDMIESQRRKPSLDLSEPLPPSPVPFTDAMLESAASSGREKLLPTLPASDFVDRSVSSISLLAHPGQWPSSPEGKRALHDAGVERMHEMERMVAEQGRALGNEEIQELQRVIEALKTQVQELSTALSIQLDESRRAQEPPPSYESGLPSVADNGSENRR